MVLIRHVESYLTKVGIDMGVDEQNVFNVTVTICISLLCRGHLIGIGIGTVCAVIGVGRTIAVFNHFTKEKMTELAGIEI